MAFTSKEKIIVGIVIGSLIVIGVLGLIFFGGKNKTS